MIFPLLAPIILFMNTNAPQGPVLSCGAFVFPCELRYLGLVQCFLTVS